MVTANTTANAILFITMVIKSNVTKDLVQLEFIITDTINSKLITIDLHDNTILCMVITADAAQLLEESSVIVRHSHIICVTMTTMNICCHCQCIDYYCEYPLICCLEMLMIKIKTITVTTLNLSIIVHPIKATRGIILNSKIPMILKMIIILNSSSLMANLSMVIIVTTTTIINSNSVCDFPKVH